VGILIISALCLVGWIAPARAGNPITQLQAEVAALQIQVNGLQTTIQSLQAQLSSTAATNALALGKYVSVDPNPEQGVAGPNVIFSGANVHIESGSGTTVDSTGLGNLVVGYNQEDASTCGPLLAVNRTGSHNFILGDCHQFTSSGSLVAGFENEISGSYSSVSGGVLNFARATDSSVSGGSGNVASGGDSSVSGGANNTASGGDSSVGGGLNNTASGVAQNIN
jgi:hypothetical protein